jgi:hypothetical protein
MNGDNNPKQPQGRGTPKGKMPSGNQFIRNLLTGIFILLLLVTLYSVISENKNQE